MKPLEGCEDDDQGFDPLDDLVDRRKEPQSNSQVKKWEEVHAALDRLTSKRREAIEAYYCRGLEISEIGDMEGTPYFTIRNRIRPGHVGAARCAGIRLLRQHSSRGQPSSAESWGVRQCGLGPAPDLASAGSVAAGHQDSRWCLTQVAALL